MSARPAGLIRPEDVSIITGQATVPAFLELDSRELTKFDRDLAKMAGYYATSRDLFKLILEDRDTYLFAAQVSKQQLNAAFGGALPGSGEFGFQFIRSKTILGTSSWVRVFAAAGWQDVFGSAASPIDLSTTSTAFGNPQNRVLLVFPKLADLLLPAKIREVWFNVAPTDYPIWPVNFINLADVGIAGLPAAVLVQKNARFYMRGNIEGAGQQSAIQPLGLTYALGPYMVGSTQE
jgi:hypothetical protein